MTDWNLFPAVTLNTLFFIIGADPMDLNRTTTGCQPHPLNVQQVTARPRLVGHLLFAGSFARYVSNASVVTCGSVGADTPDISRVQVMGSSPSMGALMVDGR